MADREVKRLTADEALAQEARRVDGAGSGDTAALCLSGGGIRSAAFSLGVLQGLARSGLLGRFHYLSTVSGGGYVGAWLTALIGAHGPAGVAVAEAELRSAGLESAPLRALRAAGNFLTPVVGAFSADTWSALTLYVRNLLMTWLAFLPPVLCLVLLLIFYRTSLAVAGGQAALAGGLLALACAGLGVSTFRACRALPSHVARPEAFAPVSRVHATVRLSLLWPALAPAAVAVGFGAETSALAGSALAGGALLGGAYALTVLAAYLCAMAADWAARRRLRAQRQPGSAAERARLRASQRLFRRNFAPWLLATLIAAALAGGGVLLLDHIVAPGGQVAVLAVLGPIWLTIAMVFHTGAHMGFRREARYAELDREWTARFSALILRAGAVAGLAAFAVLGLSSVLLHFATGAPSFWAAALSPLVSGPIAAWIGQRAISGANTALHDEHGWKDTALGIGLAVLALAFAAGLLAGLAYLLEAWVLGPVQQWLMDRACRAAPGRCIVIATVDGRPIWDVPVVVMLGLQAALLAILALVSRFIAVDNNRFSLHGLYRNRLVRGFLGAARRQRRPDPLTGFDPEDDPLLASLAPAPRRLFPVVNMAVNLTSASSLAWAERRALSFTATPLHCGFVLPGPDGAAHRTFVATQDYVGRNNAGIAQGMRLGAAMTISGAASSPDWGYHSSAATAFLMTLFNVRLGVWLPNPHAEAGVADLSQITPRMQRRALAADLLGLSGIAGRAIYLSDGGHFDNLGLYEMLRRRCRLVLVVDASEDPRCGFADLGNAVRKAAIDLGVTVTLDTSRIAARDAEADPNRPPLGFAVGRIAYPAVAGRPALEGRILYLKPTWLPDLPTDVRAHGAAERAFPHDSTIDQWFSESQFESYRHLGEHQLSLLSGGVPLPYLDSLFAAAEARHAR